ncbi:MAG: hypothetical protein R3304_10580 [Longimicrobiales bacterium]|nr:hypothetical protein [Longimicrobiales bacterium]
MTPTLSHRRLPVLFALTFALGGPAATGPAPLAGQEPPDTLGADTLTVADSALVADSAAAVTDSLGLQELPDSLSADTIFYNLPIPSQDVPASFATGIWDWDRHDVMASGAHTLAELFEEIPGLIPLLGGDYGTPLAMAAFGRGAGGYRVIRDGFELYPVDGSVPNLQQISLAGIQRVRLDRSMGQAVVELWSYRHDDGRPFSLIEAGTGDLDTNLFRGVYTDPTALMGSVAVGLERVDTRGPAPSEGGNRTGAWARYQYHFGPSAGIAVDYRSGSSQTQVEQYAPEVSRKDLMLQVSWRPVEGVVLQAMTGRSTLDRQPLVGEDDTRVGGSRRQHALRVGLRGSIFWADGSFRSFEGGLPTRRFDAAGGISHGRWGGASGRVSTGTWLGARATHLSARTWVSPLPWVTLFGQYVTGDFGARSGPLTDGPPPPPLVGGGLPGTPVLTEREGLRVGGMLSGWGFTMGGATLYSYSDRVAPLGLELDQGVPEVPGVHRRGYEGIGVIPLPLGGFTVEGSYQWWDEEGPYLPPRIYRGSLEFHRVFLESGNLEVWGSLGVRGHDPMLTFAPERPGTGEGPEVGGTVARVPFFQSWYAHAQVRVVTVRLWIGMENMTFRRNLQTYPERILPFARTFFALRWDMWN